MRESEQRSVRGETVPEVMRSAASRWPGVCCVEDERKALSYVEVVALAERLATTLVDQGVRGGDRVGLWMATSVDWLIADVACGMVGAAMVPINAQLSAAEVSFMLRAASVSVLLFDRHHGTVDRLAALEPHRAALPILRCVIVRGEVASGCIAWTDALAGRPATLPNGPDPDDLAYVSFTSGTTSLPKGVALTHRSVLTAARNAAASFEWRASERNYCAAPFYSSYGLITNILGAAVVGATTVCSARFVAADVLAMVRSGGISTMVGVDTIYRDLVALANSAPSTSEATVPGPRAAMCVPVNESLASDIRRALGFADIYTGYGLTEASACSSIRAVSPGAADDVRLAPFREHGFRVVDPETATAVKVGNVGELLLSGPSLMAEYDGDPIETARALADGWLRTGDLFRLESGGEVVFAGRLKDVIKSGGMTISAAEVEAALMQHEAVLHASVVGVPDLRLTEIAVAFVVAVPGQRIDIDELRAWIGHRLARYKIPRRILAIDELPLTGTGKVQKNKLRHLAAELH